MICSISGVPRIIHTKILVIHRKGGILDIDPNVITSPSGSDAASVIANMIIVTPKPCERDLVTSRKLIVKPL